MFVLTVSKALQINQRQLLIILLKLRQVLKIKGKTSAKEHKNLLTNVMIIPKRALEIGVSGVSAMVFKRPKAVFFYYAISIKLLSYW